MIVLKLKKAKLTTAISTFDPDLPITIEAQKAAFKNWTKTFPKILVSGPFAPPEADGIRHVKTSSLAPIRNILGTYMMGMPSIEICMLANPEVYFEGDADALMTHAQKMGSEMTWACHCDIGVKHEAFIMSAPVVAHLMNDIDPKMSFKSDWQTWTHNWMGRLMRHRYFDATPFNLIVPINQPAVEIAIASKPLYPEYGISVLVQPEKPRRGRPKKA